MITQPYPDGNGVQAEEPKEWQLRLYIAGQTPKSVAAFANLKRICEEYLAGKFEIEVIDLIGAGLSTKEISARLNLSSHTVKSHVRNVMVKLALHTRLQIAAHAHQERAI